MKKQDEQTPIPVKREVRPFSIGDAARVVMEQMVLDDPSLASAFGFQVVTVPEPQTDPGQERSRARKAWWEKVRFEKDRGGWSTLQLSSNGGPAFKTSKKYLEGMNTSQTPYVRGKFAKALKCPVSEVPE